MVEEGCFGWSWDAFVETRGMPWKDVTGERFYANPDLGMVHYINDGDEVLGEKNTTKLFRSISWTRYWCVFIYSTKPNLTILDYTSLPKLYSLKYIYLKLFPIPFIINS